MNKGYFKISDAAYKNDWDIVHILMKDFRPIHIEFRHWENDTWYIYGLSSLFKKLKEGESVPQYEFELNRDKDGKIIYKFKKP